MKLLQFLLATLPALGATPALAGSGPSQQGEPAERPNIVIFLLDDAGFAHLGSFGGQIATPNIDRVAEMGLRYTNFHTTALCSPSRAALLTGRNHHSVGTGVITEISTDEPGYTGRIPADKFPLVEALRENGYRTAAFGKWHNTTLDQIGTTAPHDRRPTDLGFDRFYGFMAGDASQWETAVWDDNELIQPDQAPGSDYHFTTDMTDKALEWLEQGDADEPFFLWYATGAVHAPHHAPSEYIEKYAGHFDAGYDQARIEILERQKALGILPEDTRLTPLAEDIQPWEDLSPEQRELYARFQEVFAGYLEHTDAQFGRVLDALQQSGKLDNTIVIVTSDNGASGEGGPIGTYNEGRFFNDLPETFALNEARIDELGTRYTYNHYPAGWAQAGNTPFKLFKQTTNEGGVRDPFIIAWPAKIKEHGALRTQFAHLIDVMPTLLEVTGVQPLQSVNGVEQKPIEGKSFAETLFTSDAPTPRHIQYFEMLGNRALWQDGWKAVAFHGRLPWDTGTNPDFASDVWHLYDMTTDVNEADDLSACYPERLEAMKEAFDEQARKYNVYPLDDSTTARFAATVRAILGDRKRFTYYADQQGIPTVIGAPTLNVSHEIIATLTVPKQGAEGVIVAMGGRFGGYALYIQDGLLRYSHNYVGEETYDVVATEGLPPGDVTVRALFTKTGENQGTMTLFADDRKIGIGDIPRTVPLTWGLGDSFDIGMDLSTPVSDAYEIPFAFTGEIHQVDINLLEEEGTPETTTATNE